ncbi:hypothetical protein BDC45DRAFT_438448 [Circinella umbellata]|nr:hypothetical protein BDC45DRAFT_438448 [Circinella umbellata]
MELPATEFDEKGRRKQKLNISNRIRTAKYTPLSFIPKNLFEQFRNVANLYFLFLVILQCIPIFGVVQPAVSALPLIAILVITGIKDGIEDLKRNQSDDRVNNAKTLTLNNWKNTNLPDSTGGFFSIFIGFFYVMAGIENKYSQAYRESLTKRKNKQKKNGVDRSRRGTEDKLPLNELNLPSSSASSQIGDQPPLQPPLPSFHQQQQGNNHHAPTRNGSKFRLRSNTLRSMFRPPQKPYNPNKVRHSVLYRIDSTPAPSSRRGSTVHPALLPPVKAPLEGPLAANGDVAWKPTSWKDVHPGDYILIRNDEDVPADVVILSTSDPDHICYIETQNLDGETNLKVRQALVATSEINSVKDCQHGEFYIESEPPHVNLYQYSGVLKWQIQDQQTIHSNITHEKTEAVTYNNILLRGCVVRNTEWVIGVVVYTGDDTKIMMNTGQTPSKRSKMAKKTNPHVIANFVILAIICVISSVMDSILFRSEGSARFFDYEISGTNATYDGFITFWVTLILYQNIVPISLYISVEIVKTFAAYFIYSDIEIYHPETDTPCIAKTWNISDDLGQIEYIFSDKTGTLTQNVMEYRKCTINGVKYGLGTTEASMGAKIREAVEKRQSKHQALGDFDDLEDLVDNDSSTLHINDSTAILDQAKKEMYEKQARLFQNDHVGPNPTFIDPKLYDDLADSETAQANFITHFFMTLSLCHTVIAERPDEENPNMIDYKAQSPDEAALVATARDCGFVFVGREANTVHVRIKGEDKYFEILNVLEFNSARKRMSVILKPHDSDKIILLCKGADSIIYERLCEDFGGQTELQTSQEELKESTSAQLEEFATEGLRTLCLAYRFISMEEYKPWNKRYLEASASIYNREEKIDEACEAIETNMLLMGGTAIEDRLQIGVPETIAELAKSGIKLWVLTGDKTETAINIGFACNLLSQEMDLIIIKGQTREETKTQLEEALESTNTEGERKRALVIDGTTLKYALEPKTKDMVLLLGMRCNSVLCCRVSPKQKAQVVALVKKGLKVMTLAIGDGANDVSMIQEANIGIGISGLEGRQAVMASDYAIAQFRFLHRLLLVHGRWSYIRTSEMIMGFFYKNIFWTFILFWYQIFCQFTGSMLFEYALVSLYNVVFTSLPIIFLGIWDQDLSAKISLMYPELYRMGPRNDLFKTWRFWLTMFDSIYQSVVCFFFPYMLLIGGGVDPIGLDQNSMYEIGTLVSSIAVCVANFFVAASLYSFTWIQIGVIALSILVYYAFVCIYAQFNTFIFAGHSRVFATGMYWLIFILTIVACFIPRFIALHLLHQYKPYDNDIIREKELVLKKKNKATNKSSSPVENPSTSGPNEGVYDIKLQDR